MALSPFAIGGNNPVTIRSRSTSPLAQALLAAQQPSNYGPGPYIGTLAGSGWSGPDTTLHPAPAGPGGPSAPQGPNSPGPNASDPYNLNNDPIYLRALSEANAERGSNASDYLAQLEQSLLGFGSQQLAQQALQGITPELEGYLQQAGVLGKGGHLDLSNFYKSFYLHDQNGNLINGPDGQPLTIADRGQGFSTLAQLNRNAFDASNNTVNANRLQNLAYSSTGGQRLQDTAYQNQNALNTASQAEQQQLGQLLQSYHQGLNQTNTNLNNSAESAYQRLVDQALKNGQGPAPTPGPPQATGPNASAAYPRVGTTAQINTASGSALRAARKQNLSQPRQALAARSAGMNAFYGLS